MQDEKIPNNQTFSEAIDYMGDKVANWHKGISDSADMHSTADAPTNTAVPVIFVK